MGKQFLPHMEFKLASQSQNCILASSVQKSCTDSSSQKQCRILIYNAWVLQSPLQFVCKLANQFRNIHVKNVRANKREYGNHIMSDVRSGKILQQISSIQSLSLPKYIKKPTSFVNQRLLHRLLALPSTRKILCHHTIINHF